MRRLTDRWFIEDIAAGHGVSANVYKGYDASEAMHSVAVKLFHGIRSENPVLQKSFQNELRIFSDLTHPNIVEFIDWGEDENKHPYLVLEWIPRDFRSYLAAASIEGWDDFAEIALGILRGLAHIHERGHLHRDIKPSNILVTEEGVPKISDFGISRLRDSVTYDVVTFLGGGTEPYRPPVTSGDGKTSADPEEPLSYHFDRDVYAFAVLVVEALIGRTLKDRADVEIALEEIDPPAAVLKLLRDALCLDCERRPATAGAALRRLEAIQKERERHFCPKIMVPIDITTRAVQTVATYSGMTVEQAEAFMLEDLNNDAVVDIRPAGEKARMDQYREDDLSVSAMAYKYRLRQDSEDPALWVVIGAIKNSATMDTARERGFRGNIIFKQYKQCASRTREAADQFFDSVAEHIQSRIAEEKTDMVRQLFNRWSSVLYAKKQFEEDRGKPIRFKDVRVDGRRVWLEVGKAAAEDLIGQPRVIRLGEYRLPIRGEVEQVSDGRIALYVESGSLTDLPHSGELHYDTDAAKAALKRQEAALNAVRHGRSVRSDLCELIARPGEAATPRVVEDVRFFHDDLDESKRNAVAAALGLEDLMVVEGPPGTGKTTFIAEVVAQFKSHNPDARILLSSQTHAALDNALERIHALMPNLRLVRLGRADRISDDVEHLRLEPQLESWRLEVLNAGRLFLKQKAEEWGVSTSQAEVTSLASSLRDISKQISALRSQLKREQDERGVAEKQLEKLKAWGPKVLDMAEHLEGLLRDSDVDALEQAAKAFLDHGLDLAAALEEGGGTAAIVVEYGERLKETNRLLKEVLEDERALRSRLSEILGRSTEDLASTTELIEAAANYSVDDERLVQLEELYADWDRRFARSLDFGAALMAAADVVAATCVGGSFGATSEAEYDLCIIDEVSKATPTEALIPMSRSRRWILVGDRRQLPPFQETALTDPVVQQRFKLSDEIFAETLLDRIADNLPNSSHFLLSQQHRMAPPIGNLVSECFYEGRLTSAKKEIPDYVLRAFGAPVVWFSTSSSSRRAEAQAIGSTSYSNELEAYEIRALMISLALYTQGQRLSVAVLTGYADQRDLIRKVLNAAVDSLGAIEYEVATVDAFQGREADVCIFSLVRSNEKGELGFLSSQQRVNVALSRGRLGLAIVGDAAFVETSRARKNPLSDVLVYMRHNHETCVISEVIE